MQDSLTIHSFQCPSCGAPILPKGDSAVISCPYCHTSVIVPEGLRRETAQAPWTTSLFESFASGRNGWLVGSLGSDYFSPLSQTIADGRYRWDALIGPSVGMSTAWLPAYRVADFHFAAHAKHIVGSKNASSWGVIFRVQDNRNYVWFRMTDSQVFAVSVVKDGQWQVITDWTRSSAIQPDGINKLEVIGAGSHFDLLINGQVVFGFDDAHFEKGLVGLAIEGYTPGERTVFDFLDVLLRAP